MDGPHLSCLISQVYEVQKAEALKEGKEPPEKPQELEEESPKVRQ